MMTEEALDVVDTIKEIGEETLEQLSKPKAKRAKKVVDAMHPEWSDEAPKVKRKLAPTKAEKEARSAKATKRLKGVLKLHGGTDAEIEDVVKKRAKATTVRKPKRAKLVAKQRASAKRPPVRGEKTMPRSYQKREGVAQGTEIAGGARQTVCTFPAKMFAAIAKLATRDNVSFTEQVRRLCVKGLKG